MATIVRGPRAADHFTIISNAALRDERLSWKARGLLSYLLSMETGWETSVRRLATVAPDGKTVVETALAELEAAGYLERRQGRGDGEKAGKFGGTEYHVRDDATVTRFPGHGDDPTVTGFSGDGFSGPGESATKKTSPKKTSDQEDRTAARSAASAPPVETSSSSITSGDVRDAAATTTDPDARGDATRATPDQVLEAMMLNTDEAARFRTWLVDATGATNPDGLILTLHTGSRLSERIAQWRTAETFTRTIPGPPPGRTTPRWCGECDRDTRTVLFNHDPFTGRELVRRCPACNPNLGVTPAGTGAAKEIAADAATVDRSPGAGREAVLAVRRSLPAGAARRTTTIGTVLDVAATRATQDGAL